MTKFNFCLLVLIALILEQICCSNDDNNNNSHRSELARQAISKASDYLTKMPEKIYACDFEVFGIVQGVFFRKHTEKQAKQLKLRGWCMNTQDGTVKGQLEGHLPKMKEMQKWLETTGSPSSRIDRTIFSELKEIPDYNFSSFSIRR